MAGKSDPYVILVYGDQTAKSKVINGNLNPVWQFQVGYNDI